MEKQYIVEISELVSNILTVEASSQKEAFAKAMEWFQLSDGGTYFADSDIVSVSVDGEDMDF
jgi:hypothetical protein